MKNQAVFPGILIAFILTFGLASCESRKPENLTKPQEFEPATEVAPETSAEALPEDTSETVAENPEEIKPVPRPLPSKETLKVVSPDLEAKRALNNDAMKAAQMKPEAFIRYMESRIPYYKGKGNLKAENDMVRIRISENEMQLETIKGSQTFPMQ